MTNVTVLVWTKWTGCSLDYSESGEIATLSSSNFSPVDGSEGVGNCATLRALMPLAHPEDNETGREVYYSGLRSVLRKRLPSPAMTGTTRTSVSAVSVGVVDPASSNASAALPTNGAMIAPVPHARPIISELANPALFGMSLWPRTMFREMDDMIAAPPTATGMSAQCPSTRSAK